MRPKSTRARAVLGGGALGTTMLAVGTTAAAQQEAPASAAAQTAAPAAAAPAPARTATRIRVLRKRLNVPAGKKARVRGRVLPGTAGRKVRLQKWARGSWKTLAAARTGSAGRFKVAVRLRRVDVTGVRVSFEGDRTGRRSVRRVGRLRVFRPALASWYGPGLYGNGMACGGTLTPGTVGVAHKSLPCGTKLVLRKGDRFVRARVVDRGPYVGAREFDLTSATKNRLGFGSTGRVWVAH
jgi:rare lipoprotein A